MHRNPEGLIEGGKAGKPADRPPGDRGVVPPVGGGHRVTRCRRDGAAKRRAHQADQRGSQTHLWPWAASRYRGLRPASAGGCAPARGGLSPTIPIRMCRSGRAWASSRWTAMIGEAPRRYCATRTGRCTGPSGLAAVKPADSQASLALRFAGDHGLQFRELRGRLDRPARRRHARRAPRATPPRGCARASTPSPPAPRGRPRRQSANSWP